MKRTLATALSGLVLTSLLGCESAVLVNNRPDTGPALSPDNAQTVSYRENPADGARPAASTTQPAQAVQTKNTRIELQNP
jgi:hypothetical protein